MHKEGRWVVEELDGGGGWWVQVLTRATRASHELDK